MTKVDIFSGFLGAGKTTLIKKLISEAYKGEKLVLIENEFGDISVDSGFMKESGIQVNELNSGCICCTLFGDFQKALGQVIEQFSPDRILIEPSGVGKLGDVILAVQSVEGVEVNSATAVVDASKAKMYMKNFGEFYADQIEHAGAIVLSRTGGISEEKLDGCVAMLREMNTMATIVTTPWDELDGKKIQKAIEKTETLEKELEELSKIDTAELEEHAHHHHHHHHHGHDADEIFESWGMETPAYYSEQEIRDILAKLEDEETYGIVLRSKGMLPAGDGSWIHFDYVPGEPQTRLGSADVTGKICVIGSGLKEDALLELFRRVK